MEKGCNNPRGNRILFKGKDCTCNIYLHGFPTTFTIFPFKKYGVPCNSYSLVSIDIAEKPYEYCKSFKRFPWDIGKIFNCYE
jgi:hypothetical protein